MSYLTPKYNQFKNYNSKPVIKKKDFEIKEDEFPDLVSSVKNNNNINVKSFSFLLNKEEIIEVEKDISDKEIQPGWSYYKYTKFKNGLCGDKNLEVTTKIQKPLINKIYEPVKQKKVLNEEEEIINALTLLQEKRTNEYKELWGEDEWERMFVFPNYDYEYFDKLDEAYEAEEEKLNEQYYNDYNDYDYDYEDSDNY
jgi:hypothetical protein